MSNTIAQNLTRLSNARDSIASAITAKGGTVASGAGFEDFSTAIANLPTSNDIVGFVASPFVVARTGSQFDTSKDFDIVVAFWLGANHPTIKGALFGTNYSGAFYKYPSIEIFSDHIWCGLSENGGSWQYSFDFNVSWVEDSYNYVKLSYRKSTGMATYYTSTDGASWTQVGQINTSDTTLYNTSSFNLCMGTNAIDSNLNVPCSSDMYIAVERCKIISEGTLIFGY